MLLILVLTVCCLTLVAVVIDDANGNRDAFLAFACFFALTVIVVVVVLIVLIMVVVYVVFVGSGAFSCGERLLVD